MSIIQAIIFGIIQGIAEFLPISSSGHLALAKNIFGTETPNDFAFSIILHLATLLSVCIVYRQDVALLFKSFFSLVSKLFCGKLKQGLDSGEKLFLMLCVATLPLIPLKLLGLDELVEDLGNISYIVGILLIINGVMLVMSDRLSSGSKTVEKGGFLRPLGVGILQAVLGVLPGISRSGSTITGGRFFGYTREEAVRFSFLMSIPAILGACVATVPNLLETGVDTQLIIPMICGAVTAAVVGFFAIKLLQYLTKNKSFSAFAVYCVIVGIAAIVFDLI